MREHLDGYTQLIGLLAYPIRHSLSPQMHNIIYSHLKLPYVYLAFEVTQAKLADAISGVRALGMRGCAVSMPNKQLVCQYLDQLSPEAKLMDACNTIVNENGVLTGYNTDGMGYMRALQEAGVQLTGRKLTLIGAGGAATAIAVQAALDGVKSIAIFNPRDQFFVKAQTLVAKLNQQTACQVELFDLADHDALKSAISQSTVLTNATGVGMKPLENQSPITEASWLHPELVVTDCIYVPRQTAFLKMAQQQGCHTLNGIGMMLWQGAAQVKLWTGQDAPVELVKQKMGFS